MKRRVLSRVLAVVVAPMIGAALGALIWASPASAHEVTGIDAACSVVTVHVVNFPKAGVMVHIAVTVEGHATLSTDVLINSRTSSATLNITAATADMGGASADVSVDVSWTFDGDQHIHQVVSVMCGTATTTTSTGVTTTTAGGSTTTSTIPESTSTTMPGSTTTMSTPESTTTMSLPTSTTSSTVLGGASGGSTTTTSAAAIGARGSRGLLAESAGASGTVGATGGTEVLGAFPTSGTSSGSLPFTGAATAPLLCVGVGLLASGAAVVSSARRRVGASS